MTLRFFDFVGFWNMGNALIMLLTSSWVTKDFSDLGLAVGLNVFTLGFFDLFCSNVQHSLSGTWWCIFLQ
jgi:hypothetical protein